jgi:hypothetical protein
MMSSKSFKKHNTKLCIEIKISITKIKKLFEKEISIKSKEQKKYFQKMEEIFIQHLVQEDYDYLLI